MKKVLTISVAAYNAEKWLCKCLDSFLVQDVMDDIEVFIVNDGSKDDTKKLALAYEEKYPGIFHLIDKENGGHGSTINAAIPKAQGKYFKIVDADDWVESEGLIQLVNLLKKQDVDAVLSPYYMVDSKSGRKARIDCMPAQEELRNRYYKKIFFRLTRSAFMSILSTLFFTSVMLKMFLCQNFLFMII